MECTLVGTEWNFEFHDTFHTLLQNDIKHPFVLAVFKMVYCLVCLITLDLNFFRCLIGDEVRSIIFYYSMYH